jgi:hypothetical protein
MDAPRLPDDSVKVHIRPVVCRQPRIESGRQLAPCFAYFIGFQRTLDDIGDRTLLTACETVGKFARLGAANRKLRFGRKSLLSLQER